MISLLRWVEHVPPKCTHCADKNKHQDTESGALPCCRSDPTSAKTAPRAFIRDRRGATAIEYALIAAAIFLAIVPPMAVVATNMSSTYQRILSYFDAI